MRKQGREYVHSHMIALGNMRKREVKKTSTDPIKRNNKTKINGLHEIPTENKIYRKKKMNSIDLKQTHKKSHWKQLKYFEFSYLQRKGVAYSTTGTDWN